MAGPNLHPDASGEALGDEHGGNTDQPDDGRDEQGRLPAPRDAADHQASGPKSAGMTTENAGALTGASGLAKARKSAEKSSG